MWFLFELFFELILELLLPSSSASWQPKYWRVFVSISVGFAIGVMVLGVFFRDSSSLFRSDLASFLSGLAGSVPGLLVGVIWHRRSSPE
jgi:glucan phosphoethanolaminetransferase (alkaline phosphatase superfamily)